MADPNSDMSADDQTNGDASAGGDAGGDQDSGSTVLLTVLKNSDGTYQLVEGDEPEPGEGGDEGAAPQSTTYDSAPKLLKGILDCLRKDEEGDEGSPQANLEAGFNGDSAPAAGKPSAY